MISRALPEPDSPARRRYEVCRAYSLRAPPPINSPCGFNSMSAPSARLSATSCATPTSTASSPPGSSVRKTAPKRQAIQERACALRGQGATLADIRATLQREGVDIGESYLFRVLRPAAAGRGTRKRRPAPKPGEFARDGSVVPDVADVHMLSLEEGRRFSTKIAGLFLFLPMLLDLDLPAALATAELPGSEQIPPLPRCSASLPPNSWENDLSAISAICVMMKAPGCSPASTSCPRPPSRPTIPTRPTVHDRATGRRRDRQDSAGRPSPELQPRLPRDPVPRCRTRPGEPLGGARNRAFPR